MKFVVLSLLLVGAFAAPSHKPIFRRGLNRIVGGVDAKAGELPYQLSFREKVFGFDFHFCGASIYSENYGLCAAHCVHGQDLENPTNFKIVAGELDSSMDEGTEQVVGLSLIIEHENYDSITVENDVSLLKFSEPLKFNNYVQAIPLPPAGHVASGDCTVSGWGTLSSGGDTPNVLQKVDVTIVSDEECRSHYGEDEITDAMVCAGSPDGGKDSCQGDSGGPLACHDIGSTYQAGIVSWGLGCGLRRFPGVYTEVSYFVDWIQTNAA